MDVTITVRVCDKCKRRDRPATRYSLSTEGDEPKTRDLCDEDAAPVLEVFDLTVSEAGEPEPAQREDKPPAQRKAPAAKAAKKAPAKQTASRRRGRTPVMSLEEIEKLKAKKS
ncbi:hypothetical protein [Streptomyces sp. NPDC000229]|uniref:hypothetical protein n=1 Tax=Streptomyces sp. NPDC000229 TaxID=3154247 RepID=UPI003325E062